MCDQSYNGYTNFETWLMSLNLDNEQFLNEMVLQIANGRGSTYDKSKDLKSQVEELFFVEEHGIYKICDTWTERDFQTIDWIDIIESHIEED
jgi:hypothetical protein